MISSRTRERKVTIFFDVTPRQRPNRDWQVEIANGCVIPIQWITEYHFGYNALSLVSDVEVSECTDAKEHCLLLASESMGATSPILIPLNLIRKVEINEKEVLTPRN